MKKAIGIYVKLTTDPTKYGFAPSDDGLGFMRRYKGCRAGLYIDGDTGRLTPYLGYTSQSVATIIRMAEDKALEIDDSSDEGKQIMRLTREEVIAIEKMRGHPKEEKDEN